MDSSPDGDLGRLRRTFNKKVVWHEGLGDVIKSLARLETRDSEATLILRVRTTDRNADSNMIESLSDARFIVDFAEPPNPDFASLAGNDCSRFRAFPAIDIELFETADMNYYEIRASYIPADKDDDARKKLAAVALMVLEKKEESQCPNETTASVKSALESSSE